MASLPTRTRRRSGGLVPLDNDVVALIYRRVSSREQANEGVSLEAQLKEARAYIVGHPGWMLDEEYEDVESGRRDDREQYRRLLLDIRGHRLAGRRVVLVVAALDRLGRNVAERVRVWDELKRLDVPLYSIREGGIQTEFTYNILAAVAQEESRKIGERVRSSSQYFISMGWRSIGRVAWGYRLRDATAAERALGSPKRVLAGS